MKYELNHTDRNGESHLLTGTAEEIAREILELGGVTLTDSPGFKYLLVDTIREVEYHASPLTDTDLGPIDFSDPEPEVEQSGYEGPQYVVVKEEWEIPCDFYACETMHRHLANRPVEPFWTDVYNLQGDKIGRREIRRVHDVKRTDWLVIDMASGDRVDAYDRRKDARAHAERLNRRNA